MTRGELWWADFGVPFGSEPGFERPVIIAQDDSFNRSGIRTVIVVPLTTNLRLADAPGNVPLSPADSGLPKDSVAVVSQLYALDKARLIGKVRSLDAAPLREIERGLILVLGLRGI